MPSYTFKTLKTFTEDDLLSIWGKHLNLNSYKILALSGNQQGMYCYNIKGYRKAPDIIAINNNKLIIGEAKLLSKDLFRVDKRGISDYNSLEYIFNHPETQLIFKKKVSEKLKTLGYEWDLNMKICLLLLSSTLFDESVNDLLDYNISAISINLSEETISSKIDNNNNFTEFI